MERTASRVFKEHGDREKHLQGKKVAAVGRSTG
jgi:hypothetical protein